jgi:hypothetical protein
MRMFGEWRYSSISSLSSEIETSGQLHVPLDLSLERRPLLPIGCLDAVDERILSYSCLEANPVTSAVQPWVYSLYQLQSAYILVGMCKIGESGENICKAKIGNSSLARTLRSWVRISLKAWMSVYVYSVFVLSCVGSGLATGWSPVKGVLPTVLNQETEEKQSILRMPYAPKWEQQKRERERGGISGGWTKYNNAINCISRLILSGNQFSKDGTVKSYWTHGKERNDFGCKKCSPSQISYKSSFLLSLEISCLYLYLQSTGCWWESHKERDHYEDEDVGGWTILKWISER